MFAEGIKYINTIPCSLKVSNISMQIITIPCSLNEGIRYFNTIPCSKKIINIPMRMLLVKKKVSSNNQDGEFVIEKITLSESRKKKNCSFIFIFQHPVSILSRYELDSLP